MILKLAWKNIWRNKLRSFVMLTAIALGLMVSMVLVAFSNGLINQKINDVINTEMTHLQINRQPFIDYGDIEYTFNSQELENDISKLENIEGISPRIKMNVMVSSPYKTGGITMMGVDPEKEKTVSLLHKYFTDSTGNYFTDNKKNNIVIGKEMAEKYKIRLKSKIVLSFVDINGEQVAGAFRVCGIFETNNPTFEQSVTFVKTNDIRDLSAVPKGISHELAIRLSDNSNETLDKVRSEIKLMLSGDEKIRSWKDISSMMAIYTDYMGFYMFIMVGIILFALSFGIINVVLMSVMERRRELSMLMAIGMTPKRVMLLIITEGTLLTLIGGLSGIILGLAIIGITSFTGIDIMGSMSSIESMGFATLIYPEISLREIIPVTIMIIIAGILSAIYPARKAVKVKPAEGIK